MNLYMVAWTYLRGRWLATILTTFSVALGGKPHHCYGAVNTRDSRRLHYWHHGLQPADRGQGQCHPR